MQFPPFGSNFLRQEEPVSACIRFSPISCSGQVCVHRFIGNFHLMIQMQTMMSTICAPTFVASIRRPNQCLTPIGVNACSTRWIWRCSLASWVKRHGCSNIFSCVLSKSAHRATGCVCIAYPIATSSSHTPTFVGKILWRLLPKIPAHNVG